MPLHLNDIQYVTITEAGYLVTTAEGSSLVDEEDVALMIFLENNGVVFEEDIEVDHKN